MSRAPEPSASARIEVSDHALERARDRIGWEDAQRIRTEIRAAILLDRVTETRPDWAGGTFDAKSDGDHYFAYNGDATRCWVMTTWGGTIVVKTLLLDHETLRAISETRHLRPGFRRRR